MCSMIEVCFMCSNNKNCIVVSHKIVSQVEYLLPEISIFKFGLQLRICSICQEKLHSFSKFKQDSVENILRLETRIRESQFEDKSSADMSIHAQNQPSDTSDSDDESIALEPNLHNFLEIYIKEEPQDEKTQNQNIDDSKIREFYDDVMHNSQVQDLSMSNNGNTSNSDKNPTPGKKKLQCPICSKLFNDRSNLRKHIIAHTGVKNCLCPICNKLFARNSSLKTHLKIHSGIKDYVCTICNKQFTQNSHLKFHMKIHSGEREFVCNICNKTFNRSERLKKHLITHTESKAVECSFCKKMIQPNNIGKHLEAHTRVKTYQCNICNKMLTNSSNLSKHLKIHSGVKDYQCKICNKMFIRKDKLKIHMNVHLRMNLNPELASLMDTSDSTIDTTTESTVDNHMDTDTETNTDNESFAKNKTDTKENEQVSTSTVHIKIEDSNDDAEDSEMAVDYSKPNVIVKTEPDTNQDDSTGIIDYSIPDAKQNITTNNTQNYSGSQNVQDFTDAIDNSKMQDVQIVTSKSFAQNDDANQNEDAYNTTSANNMQNNNGSQNVQDFTDAIDNSKMQDAQVVTSNSFAQNDDADQNEDALNTTSANNVQNNSGSQNIQDFTDTIDNSKMQDAQVVTSNSCTQNDEANQIIDYSKTDIDANQIVQSPTFAKNDWGIQNMHVLAGLIANYSKMPIENQDEKDSRRVSYAANQNENSTGQIIDYSLEKMAQDLQVSTSTTFAQNSSQNVQDYTGLLDYSNIDATLNSDDSTDITNYSKNETENQNVLDSINAAYVKSDFENAAYEKSDDDNEDVQDYTCFPLDFVKTEIPDSSDSEAD